MDNLLGVDELCDHELIVVFSQPGLHANHLRGSQSSNRVSSFLQQSSSSFQVPHVTSLSEKTFQELAVQVSERCGHRVSKDTLEGKLPSLSKGGKHIICMEGKTHHQESSLMDRLESITQQTPNHLVIFAGVPTKSHSRRQVSPLQTPTATVSATPFAQGGIFKRYQLFTPTLLTALLIFVFIWIPIVFVALKALSSIQVPRIGSIGKSVTSEKKNQ